MAEQVPLPHEDSSQSGRPPGFEDEELNPSDDGVSSGAKDPWGRSDPWSASRGRGTRQLDRRMEEEFIQFVQWRNMQNEATEGGLRGNLYGGVAGGGAAWYAARDEHERTTAGPPPEWDGSSIEFRDYKLKAKIWLRTTRTPAYARGPLLLKNLTKGPWEDLKFLASDESWLNDTKNGEKLIALMDSKEFYGEEQRESMLAACSRLTFHLKRTKGETARSFMTRWDNAERKVREHEVKLPADFLGFLMVNALQLDSEKTKLLLNYTKGSLKVSDVKEWLRIHETDLDLANLGSDKKKNAINYVTAEHGRETHYDDVPDETYEIDELEEPTEVMLATLAELDDPEASGEEPSVILTEAETKEIMLTMVRDSKGRGKGRTFSGALKAKKNRDLARGYGAGRDGALRPGTYQVSISELKKRTKCNRCGAVGHWARECSMPKATSTASSSSRSSTTTAKEMNYLQMESIPESEFYYLEADEEFSRPTVGRLVDPLASNSDDESVSNSDLLFRGVYKERPRIFPCYHLIYQEDTGCATIDTGCQRMAIGLVTLQKLQRTQPSELPIIFRNEKHQFRSVHKVSCTERLACIPCSLGPRGCVLRPAVFEEEHSSEAPFLLSLPFLLHCEATLILDENKGLTLVSKQFDFKVACHLGPSGALRVPIQQFTTLMMRHLVDQLGSNTDEYEVLQTEQIGTANVSAGEPISASRDYTRLSDRCSNPGTSSIRDPSSHGDRRAFYEARPQRTDLESSDPAGLGADGHQGSDHHWSGNRTPSTGAPQDAKTSWCYGSADSGDGCLDGDRSAGSAGGADGRTTSGTSSIHDATPPESEWSKVSSQTPRRSVSETPLTPPRPSSEIPQTPEYRQPSMWEVPPTVEVNKAPICRCGDRATIFISKTARNPDRLFWRCPRGRGKQCSFFQWLEDQSFQIRDVQPQSMEYIRKRMQEECPHRITTRAGPNAFFDQTTCKDCGKLLRKERKSRPPKAPAPAKTPTTPAYSSPPSVTSVASASIKETEEWQEFLRWKEQVEQNQNQAASSQAAPRRPSRGELFM